MEALIFGIVCGLCMWLYIEKQKLKKKLEETEKELDYINYKLKDQNLLSIIRENSE